MSDNWIRLREALPTSPHFGAIVDYLMADDELLIAVAFGAPVNVTLSRVTRHGLSRTIRDRVLAGLVRVWLAANVHTIDGVWRGITPAHIDAVAQIPDFGGAMAAAGWLEYDADAGTVTLPGFLENNVPAKDERRAKRTNDAERQRRRREKLKADASQQNEGNPGEMSRVTSRVTNRDMSRVTSRDSHGKSHVTSRDFVTLELEVEVNNKEVISNVVSKPACEREITCEERAEKDTSNPAPNSAAEDLDNLAAKIHSFPRPSYPAPDCGQIIGMLRQYGINTTAYNEATRKLATLAVDADELQAAVYRIRDNKGETFKIAPAYLATVIEAMRAEPAEKPKTKTGNAWWASFPAMEAKARELGISGARPGEETDQFKARIQTAIDSHNLKVN